MKLCLSELERRGAYIEKGERTVVHIVESSKADNIFMDWIKSTEGSAPTQILMSEIPDHILNQLVPRPVRLGTTDLNNLFLRCMTMIYVFSREKDNNKINLIDHCDLSELIEKIWESADVKDDTYICTLQTHWRGSKDTIVRQYIIK